MTETIWAGSSVSSPCEPQIESSRLDQTTSPTPCNSSTGWKAIVDDGAALTVVSDPEPKNRFDRPPRLASGSDPQPATAATRTEARTNLADTMCSFYRIDTLISASLCAVILR